MTIKSIRKEMKRKIIVLSYPTLKVATIRRNITTPSTLYANYTASEFPTVLSLNDAAM